VICVRLARGIVWSRGQTGVFRRIVWPALLLGPAIAVRLSLPVIEGPEPSWRALLLHLTALTLIGLFGWLLIAFVSLLDAYVDEAFPVGVDDNLEARRIHTRFRVLRRLFVMLTVILCGIAALMTFPGMRALGTGLLASAGIVGIVVGIAARPTVETLIAGIQLAWTQPVRLDDVVIMEVEWGRIEEIGATYVVVRLWDLRRLVVPISYLLSHPFQNWTRTSAHLLGAVTVEVDYRTPVEAVREAVGDILGQSALYEGGFWNLQVVDAGPQTMKLRVLCDVPNADVGWELRCEVREKLIAYLQQAHPDCLPRLRAELVPRSQAAAHAGDGEVSVVDAGSLAGSSDPR
jgi:small-conductance mechanosensitive channel